MAMNANAYTTPKPGNERFNQTHRLSRGRRNTTIGNRKRHKLNSTSLAQSMLFSKRKFADFVGFK